MRDRESDLRRQLDSFAEWANPLRAAFGQPLLRQSSGYKRYLTRAGWRRHEVCLIAWMAFTLGVGLTWGLTQLASWQTDRKLRRLDYVMQALNKSGSPRGPLPTRS